MATAATRPAASCRLLPPPLRRLIWKQASRSVESQACYAALALRHHDPGQRLTLPMGAGDGACPAWGEKAARPALRFPLLTVCRRNGHRRHPPRCQLSHPAAAAATANLEAGESFS